VGASMAAFGLCIAAAVYLTPWGIRTTSTPVKPRMDPPASGSKRVINRLAQAISNAGSDITSATSPADGKTAKASVGGPHGINRRP
jgi:hypothetical protein